MASEEHDMPRRRGRGTRYNPATRFESTTYVLDPAEHTEDERRQVPTQRIRDHARTILIRNDSPDIPFRYSLNPYRGCSHGCIYCYARPSHEYLGFSAGLDFETKILVKHDAPELLAKAFRKKSWKPQPVMLSGNTDPYQPMERDLGITRRCLEVFADFRNPVGIITKNALILRDLDLLKELAQLNLVAVMLSITTLDPDLVMQLEPRTARPARRLEVVQRLAQAGVPVGVNIAPVIPGLTDEELPAILEAAVEHGASFAGYGMLRLPGPVADLFADWLRDAYPDRAERVLRRVRSVRGGELTDDRFGHRMRGEGPWADLVRQLYHTTTRRLGLSGTRATLDTTQFRRPDPHGQLGLF